MRLERDEGGTENLLADCVKLPVSATEAKYLKALSLSKSAYPFQLFGYINACYCLKDNKERYFILYILS